ncbi:MAG: LysR family transcriptional regulator, partial [Pseudomonadota bacterium]
MRRELPPMNALLAFEAAARHGNFTRAAAELSVAQPAVTRHIANLESWIGAPLFSRNGSTIQLTREGKTFSELSTAVLDRLELGTRHLRRTKSDELVVGASFGIAHLWIMPRISEMRNASGRNINLVTSDDYSTFDNSSVDFSIRFGNGNFGSNCSDLLLKEQCQVIASPTFLKNHPELNPKDPSDSINPKLIFDHGDPNGIGWMDWRLWHQLTNSEFPGAEKLTLVQSYPTMLDMVC